MPRYQVTGPHIVHETIDGEVVIVNLESGNYYSLEATGQRIWAAVERAATVEDVVAELRASYDGGGDRLEETVGAFLEELRQEGLIAPLPETDPSSAGDPSTPPSPRATFTPPVLHRFEDLQELILLDPVHELQADLRWSQPRTVP